MPFGPLTKTVICTTCVKLLIRVTGAFMLTAVCAYISEAINPAHNSEDVLMQRRTPSHLSFFEFLHAIIDRFHFQIERP